MKYLVLIIIVCFSFCIHAYQPTPESLLRNTMKRDLENQAVVANLSIQNLNEPSENFLTKRFETANIKYVLTGGTSRTINQLFLGQRGKNNEDLQEFKFIRDYQVLAKSSEYSFLQRYFYGMLEVIFLNNAQILLDTTRSLGSQIEKNSELVNLEKYNLLQRYKSYLVSTEGGQSENIQHPFKTNDKEEDKKIKELLDGNFYKNSSYTSLKKILNDYYWIIEDEVFYAKIHNDTRNIEEIKINVGSETIHFMFRNHMIFNNNLHMPEEIILIINNTDKYLIKLTSLSVIDDSGDKPARRLKMYKELEEAIITKPDLKPPFII
jgi:hypothetical protein